MIEPILADMCLACNTRPACYRSLCRACHMAVYRRHKRGESWENALEDRRRQVQRAAMGWTSGVGKRAVAKAGG